MFGFTWGDLGYSQYKVLPVIQIASITGVWGVSFLLALSNSALALACLEMRHSAYSRRALPQLAAALAIVFAAITFGVWSARTAGDFSGTKLRAAVIQGNVSQDTENSAAYADEAWRNYTAMTQKASRNGANLIVWPETVVPGFLGTDPYTQDRMKSLAESARAALLVGGWDAKRDGKVLNTAFMITPFAGITGRSAKIHLVPFGEFVPARRFLPFLRYYRVRSCDTSPGDGYNVMRAGTSQIGTTVCFESAFPYVARQLVDQGAQVLCVITDDEWFGKSAAAEQHFAKSVLRAVENRRYVLRAAATGVSGIIGPNGKILDHAQSRNSALLERTITAREDRTFYTRHGDWLVWLSILIPFLLFGARGLFKRGTRL
jgi:apolipoprotein N-acyltransferase